MSIKIKDLPTGERPYEKLEEKGAKFLSNSELLAIIIKNGTKEETSVQVAQKILKLGMSDMGEDLAFLKSATLEELMQIKGIGKVKAIQLKAICELAIRLSKPNISIGTEVKNTNQIAQIVLGEFQYEKNEVARLFLLNTRNCLLKIEDVALGGTSFVKLDIKTVISSAIRGGASRIILVHNHPSGDATPSQADIHFTDKLYNSLIAFNIELMDHIIIGNMEYKSVFEHIEELCQNARQITDDRTKNQVVE